MCAIFSGCNNQGDKQSGSRAVFSSYRDIPGVTAEEIEAIEAIRKTNGTFVYGMPISTEAFKNENGEICGFTAFFCQWLTELFGITFQPALFEWLDLLNGMETGKISFSGELTSTEARLKIYKMTSAIFTRNVNSYRLVNMKPLAEIEKERPIRYGFITGAATIGAVIAVLEEGTYEVVTVPGFEYVYEALKNDKMDTFFYSGTAEMNFIQYSDMTISNVYPLIRMPVSLSTQDPALEPFISVMEKALQNGAFHHILELYNHGYQDYKKLKLFARLSEEELAYINTRPVIPFSAEYDNYPTCFFDTRSKEWLGIGFDVLKEIEFLTGIKFSIANDKQTKFSEMLQKLENKETLMHCDFIQSANRKGRFLWPNLAFKTNYAALISKMDYRNINITEIYSVRVGVSKDTAYAELFNRWFPNHNNTVLFGSQKEAFDALMHDEVDMVMNSDSSLLYLTHYLEHTEYKINFLFDYPLYSTFGFNKDEAVLASVIDKALGIVDTKGITDKWMSQTYDYRSLLARTQIPWLLGFIALSLFVLILVVVFYVKNRRTSKKLEHLVGRRTRELATQNAFMRTVIANYRGVIWSVGNDGIITTFNGQYLKTLGVAPEFLEGKNIELARKKNRHLDIIENIEKTLKEGPQDFVSDINGGVFHSRTTPLYDGDGNIIGVVGSTDDETAIFKIQQELKAALESAKAASQTKSSFLANMSHEIRTPMNAILGVTEMLIQNENLPAEINEGLDKIYNSCGLLLGIINDILDFSKIEAGKLDIMPAQYEVASMINDSINMNMMRLNSKPIEFELMINENIPAKLIGDELRIKQILNNLLSNSFKYTDAGKVTLSVEFHHTKNGDITLVLSIQDTGHGMTKEQLDKLFEEYSRFNMERNITVEGTGLGLAITQRLISLMNGEIHVESERHKGTLFVVRLPQGTEGNEVLGREIAENLRRFQMSYLAHKKRGVITRDQMPYGSVLIVDDIETNLYVAVGLMKLYNLHIDTAVSGYEAIEKIRRGKEYDVVFMDHMMPEMDGIEATKHLRASGYTAPIVALTANAVSGQADMFINNGFDDFISKPIDIRQLNSVLNRLIRDKQPPEVIEAASHYTASAQPQSDLLLAESFIKDAKKAVIWLREQIQNTGFENEETLQKFTVIVHGMKSSLLNIGQTDLAESAQKLEKASREKDMELIQASVPDFLNELRALLEEFEYKRSENNSNIVFADEDIKGLHRKLKAIQEMCLDYNRKGVMDILAEIKNSSKETKEVLDNIMGSILQSEFEEAKNLAAVYADNLLDNNKNIHKEINGGKR